MAVLVSALPFSLPQMSRAFLNRRSTRCRTAASLQARKISISFGLPKFWPNERAPSAQPCPLRLPWRLVAPAASQSASEKQKDGEALSSFTSGPPVLSQEKLEKDRCSGRLSLGHTDAFDIAVKQRLHVAGTFLGAEPEPHAAFHSECSSVKVHSHLGLRSMPRQHLPLQIRRQRLHSLRPWWIFLIGRTRPRQGCGGPRRDGRKLPALNENQQLLSQATAVTTSAPCLLLGSAPLTANARRLGAAYFSPACFFPETGMPLAWLAEGPKADALLCPEPWLATKEILACSQVSCTARSLQTRLQHIPRQQTSLGGWTEFFVSSPHKSVHRSSAHESSPELHQRSSVQNGVCCIWTYESMRQIV